MNDALTRLRRVLLDSVWLCVLTDLFALSYAAFSIVSQLTSIVGGPPRVLLPSVLVIAAGAFLLIGYVLRRRPAWFEAYLKDARATPTRPVLAAVPPSLPLRIAVSTVVALLALAIVHNTWLGWGLGSALSFAAALIAFRASTVTGAGAADGAGAASGGATGEPDWSLAVVLGCALIGAAIALLVVRPRSDDAFYSSMALSVITSPDKPLLALNTMHGPATALMGVQPMFLPYRVHSFEVLGGALSLLFGVEPVAMLHLVFGPLFALLAPFAIARALRLLTPAWALGVLAVTAFYCIEGTASVGYANHAFVRMFHGKSVLLTVGVPLLIAHGLRFGAAPNKLRFILLLATQIAAVGLSSTAIWLGPVIAMVAVWAGTPQRDQLLRRSLGALASSAYVLLLGLWVGLSLRAAIVAEAVGAEASDTPVPLKGAARLAEAVETALGTGRTALGLLCVIGLALALSRVAASFRLFAWIAAVTALFAAPFANRLVGAYIVGDSTYHRVFWLLPIPLAFGLAVAELSERLRGRWPLARALGGALAAGALLLAVTTQVLVLSDANHASFVYPPALKIGPRARGGALAACARAGKGEYILASSSVSEQVATLRNCGYPILTNARWLDVPTAELHDREELVRYVSTDDDVPVARAQWFQQALARYHPKVVVTLDEAMKNRRTKLLLRRAGYDKAEQVEGSHVWALSSQWQRSECQRVGLEVCQRLSSDAKVLAPFCVSSVMEARACAKPLLRVNATYDEKEDALAQYERVLSSESDLSDAEYIQLRLMLMSDQVSAVVVSPLGMGNGSLRGLLRDVNYRNLKVSGGYRVFARSGAPLLHIGSDAAKQQATPEPTPAATGAPVPGPQP